MITLKIDGQAVEIDEKINPAITAAIADIEEPENSSAGYSKTVEIPFTPNNRRVFGFTDELFSREQFNNALHTAEYADDDTVIMCGIAQIEKFSYITGADRQVVGGSFHVSVVGASFEWITNARKPINELVSGEAVKYTMDEVYNNSVREDASLIKFFPVDRGAFWVERNEVMEPRAALSIYDYHPFMNVWGLLKLVFKGWILRSSMSQYMGKLYCAGTMPDIENLEYLKEDNDFKCGTTSKDKMEYIAPTAPWHVNLFDKWTSGDDDECFLNTAGVLDMAPGQTSPYCTVFRPTDTVPVLFNIRVEYQTSVDADGGFIDRFRFGGNREEFKFNAFEWGALVGGTTLVSEAKSGVKYALYLKMEDYKKYTTLLCVSTFPTSSPILISNINQPEYCVICVFSSSLLARKLILRDVNGVNHNVEGLSGVEVALVPVDNENCGFTFLKEVTTTLRTVTKGESFPFYANFYYSKSNPFVIGAGGHMLTIKDCSVTPDFRALIGLGDEVSLSTIGGDGTQLDFLASIRQMFNLMFYTNSLTKEVFVEPRTTFYNLELGDLIDWRGKIDHSKEVVVEELGADVGASLKLAYNDGNEVVARYNWKNRTQLGAYSVPLLNKTSDDAKEIANPAFAPFLVREVASVGMILPQDKPEKTQDLIEEIDLDITPIIGHFAEVKTRTSGTDCGSYPKYPRLVFQDATAGVNLGFDDMLTAPITPGLNQYYQDNISAYNAGRRLTIYLKLEPQDVEAILLPNSLKRDFRGVFLLRHNGEDVPCTLESIGDYNPTSGASVKCRFVVDPNIRLTNTERVIVLYDNTAIAYGDTVLEYGENN